MKKYLSILALLACCAAASRAQVTISPAPGTYSGTQSVSMSCNPSNSTTIWYTTNGYPANTAAAMYTGPIQVSATTTINAICATTAEVDGEPGYDAEVNPQNYYDPPNGSWKCNVNNPPIESNNGEFDCTTSGGVSGVIYQWNFTEGSGSSPASLLVETQSSDPSNSMLFVYTPKTECDSCSTIAQHLVVEPTEGTAAIPNNEMDMEQCCDNTTYGLHQASLQCAGGYWDLNSSTLVEENSPYETKWLATNIPCSLSTTQHTDVVYEAQWVNGDTGCGAGTGCMYLDALTVNGVRYFPLVQYCADKPTNSDPNCAQEALVPHQGWTHWGAGNQHQIDLSSVSSCGQGSTCQGARNIYTNDITATQTTQGTASGTYAIEGSTAPTPVISMPNQTVVGQWDTISDALSNATIYWCYGAVGTCNNFQTYSGEFWVGPSSPPTETVCAYATAPGYTQSATTCNYYVAATNGTTTTPSITLASGTYQMPKSTTITDSNSAAAILWCYTGTGTCTPNTMYTGSIYIDPASTETVCATAWAPEAAQSSAVCNSYTNAQ